MHDVLWESALHTLEGRIKPHNFEMWLRPIHCKGIEGQRIVLSAPSRWIQEWFQDNYQSIVLDALRSQTNQEFELIFEVPAEVAHPEAAAAGGVVATPAESSPTASVRVDKSEPHTDL